MTTQALTVDSLREVLSQSLSPDAAIRTHAEHVLTSSRSQPGHALVVLQLIATEPLATGQLAGQPATAQQQQAVRQAAAVHFKNLIKHGWNPDDDEDEEKTPRIPECDRRTIKSHLVELMCTVPPQIQAQCSESISLIAAADFPAKWDDLLPDLVKRFSNPDAGVIHGVLLTANSIFKRFRYVQRSDELYADILYVLQRIQEPLLILFEQLNKTAKALQPSSPQWPPVMTALRSICRIFYSLTYQDLPEYFEDHMHQWMDGFAQHLESPRHHSQNEEEDEPSPLDALQVAIVQNLNLFANKDEEPFLPHLPRFTTLVWNLLLTITPMPKHDGLATISIRFLSSLVGKLMHRALFQEEATLREIFAKIVIPNLMIRETDEEKFEDDPQEFILGDMEGSDTESRRKCSQELLRAMCRQFGTETTNIASEHIRQLLSNSSSSSDSTKAKDVAIHLMLGIAIQAESAKGVSRVNDKVDILEFFSSNVLPELQEADMSKRPMLKATSIKFVNTFRNQFTKQHLEALMPLLVAHLTSPYVVVHTYAAAAIEKILTTKVDGSKVAKFGGSELKPFLGPLFTNLFAIIDNSEWNENEYVMKCTMRSLHVSKDDMLDHVQVVLDKLTTALARVAKNPRNPHYNHCLFESIAVLIRAVCSKDAQHTSAFENLLFPPFQTVLQMDIIEFTPYVFQLLAQILEYRPPDSGLGAAYTSLLSPLLTPTLWERKGNIPALNRLLQAYLLKGANDIVQQNILLGMLGVFQKLVASRANEAQAFELLRSILIHIPHEALLPRLKDIFHLLLMKLQQGRTPRYIGLISHFLALYVALYGSTSYLDQLNQIQPGLGLMLLVQVWIPRLQSPTLRTEAKTQMIGLTKLLETPALLADDNARQIWCQLLGTTIKLILSPEAQPIEMESDEGDDGIEIGYDATYSVLHFAKRPNYDPFPKVDAVSNFAHALQKLCQGQPAVKELIRQTVASDEKLGTGLDGVCQKAGVSLS